MPHFGNFDVLGFGLFGLRWPRVASGGLKCHQMASDGLRRPQGWTRMAHGWLREGLGWLREGLGWLQTASDGLRWPQMASDGLRWPQMVQGWTRMAKGWIQMASDGLGWPQMASDGLGWLGFRWIQMDSGGFGAAANDIAGRAENRRLSGAFFSCLRTFGLPRNFASPVDHNGHW
jgi:hypothetical protein